MYFAASHRADYLVIVGRASIKFQTLNHKPS